MFWRSGWDNIFVKTMAWAVYLRCGNSSNWCYCCVTVLGVFTVVALLLFCGTNSSITNTRATIWGIQADKTAFQVSSCAWLAGVSTGRSEQGISSSSWLACTALTRMLVSWLTSPVAVSGISPTGWYMSGTQFLISQCVWARYILIYIVYRPLYIHMGNSGHVYETQMVAIPWISQITEAQVLKPAVGLYVAALRFTRARVTYGLVNNLL